MILNKYDLRVRINSSGTTAYSPVAVLMNTEMSYWVP
jgi:hypothetical protein